jgi:hypothetical protein
LWVRQTEGEITNENLEKYGNTEKMLSLHESCFERERKERINK